MGVETMKDRHGIWQGYKPLPANLYNFRTLKVVTKLPLYEVRYFQPYMDKAQEVFNSPRCTTTWLEAMKHRKDDHWGNDTASYNNSFESLDKDKIHSTNAWNLRSNYYFTLYNDVLNKSILDYDNIIELGAGSGDFCKFIFNMGFTGNYTILDLPEVINLSKTNLKEYNVNFITNYKDLERQSNCLFISTWGISETPVEFRDAVFDRLRLDGLLITYQLNFEQVDNQEYFSKIKGYTLPVNWHKWDGGSNLIIS